MTSAKMENISRGRASYILIYIYFMKKHNMQHNCPQQNQDMKMILDSSVRMMDIRGKVKVMHIKEVIALKISHSAVT